MTAYGGGPYRPVRLLFLAAFCCAALTMLGVQPAGAQSRPDTVRAPVDSLRLAADTLRAMADTLALKSDSAATSSGIDSVVTYTATDSIVYDVAHRVMRSRGKATIDYKELGLKADQIDIHWTTSQLFARGSVDTTDTTGHGMKGIPDLIDGGETYHGSEIAYNFKSKKGRVDLGKTAMENGFYYGDAIKKAEPDVLYVDHGRFTTCDLDHPHYYFASPTMKVQLRDKVIARPIYLYIADVPVFALPFGVFPSDRGRRSGLIAPAYGQSARGRYMLHLGYYWAINDYMDWSVRADGYTKGSYTFYSDLRYAVRYLFSGSISGSYGHVVGVNSEKNDPTYTVQDVFNVHIGHAQDFNPTTRFTVDFTFMSGSYFQNTSNSLNDLLRQNVVSNATLTKYWEGTQNSMTVNLHRDQNLVPTAGSVELSEVLPSISFNRSQSFPFRSASSGGSGDLKWYELIGYSYSGQLTNNRITTRLDTSGTTSVDERRGVQHVVTVNASPKVGYFTLAPFFNYYEKWYDKSINRQFNAADSSIATNDVKSFRAVRYFDMGISASTRFVGIFQPNMFGIKGIRHQVLPSVSYTYQPDFSKDSYGYYGSYVDASGVRQRYSKFEKEVYGGAPTEERQALSFRIGNVFEMKTAADDTSDRTNKYTLLNLDISSGYNFARDSLRFDEVSTSFRTNIGQYLNIGGSARYNLYKFQADTNSFLGGRRVNKLLLAESGRFGDLTGFSISLGTRLSGEKKKTTAGPVRSAEDSLAERERAGFVGLYDQQAPDFSIPWNLDLTWNYSESRPGDPRLLYRSSTVGGALGFNLTEYWKITMTASYDLINKTIAAPQITVYRDLHCWEMDFSWVPTGFYRNFKLEIRLKAPQLQDVKVTKQESAREIF
ncbi:MAG: LPS-assembly protein LptD [Ignavibacteriae bacterium]|nr:LPS-assembly protein LptD [Ignavibacteriota bacterium]